jgi:hypothetical protein
MGEQVRQNRDWTSFGKTDPILGAIIEEKHEEKPLDTTGGTAPIADRLRGRAGDG